MSSPLTFIAEIGMNHNGNFDLVHELVRQARRAGADIAKFQLGWRDGPDEINRIDAEVIEKILRITEYYGVEPMFSIIRPDVWELAQRYDFKRYKIASRTVVDHPDLVRDILAQGKETFVSLGFWEGEGLPFEPAPNLRYLWCRSLYPCPIWEAKGLPRDFSASPCAGYSDHTVGIEVALLAISRGAEVIEKHFTLDKSDTTIRDHALSATPDEFALMTEIGRSMRAAMDVGV